jgi:hypothetical protein
VWLPHTAPVRRIVLARLRDYLRKSQGIDVQAENLDYNLLSPWVLLEKASLRPPGSDGLPPFLTVERARLRLNYRDLMTGSLKARSLDIYGLRIDAVVGKDGRTNILRNFQQSSESRQARLPVDVVEVAKLTLSYTDEQAGFSAQLPAGTLKGSDNPETGDQEITYSSLERGKVAWGGRELPILGLTLNVGLRNLTVALKSLHVTGEGFEIEAGGSLENLESPHFSALGQADIEGAGISPWLGLKKPLAGRLLATASVSGNLRQLTVEGEVSSAEIGMGGIRLNSLVAEGRFESSAGKLDLTKLTAKVYGGQILVGGQLSFSGEGQSTIRAEGKALDLRLIGAALGLRTPPAGEASAQLVATCPGSRWMNAEVSAGAAIKFHRGGGTRSIPDINARLTARLREKRVHVGVESLAGFGANLQGSLDAGTMDESVTGELKGSVGSLARAIHDVEGYLGRPADSLLPFPVDGSAECTATITGNFRDPRATINLEGTGLSAGRIGGARLHLLGEYSPDRFLITRADLDWRGQTATASGEIGLASDSFPWLKPSGV